MTKRHAITVCINCPHDELRKNKTGVLLHEKVRAEIERDAFLSEKIDVRTVKCMGGCDRPNAVAFTSENKDSVLFNEIELSERYIKDLLTCLKTYVRSSNGRMAKRNRPESMKENLFVRIPPFFSQKKV